MQQTNAAGGIIALDEADDEDEDDEGGDRLPSASTSPQKRRQGKAPKKTPHGPV